MFYKINGLATFCFDPFLDILSLKAMHLDLCAAIARNCGAMYPAVAGRSENVAGLGWEGLELQTVVEAAMGDPTFPHRELVESFSLAQLRSFFRLAVPSQAIGYCLPIISLRPGAATETNADPPAARECPIETTSENCLIGSTAKTCLRITGG